MPISPSCETRLVQTIGRSLRAARRRQRLTQEELALAAGVSVRTLSSIEKGSPSARLDGVARALQAVGLTLVVTETHRAPRR